jgi:hypothetical protein
MRQWVKALPLGIGLPVVIAAASVKPEDAASNLSAWTHWIGINDAPSWLASPAIDSKVIVGALVGAAIYAAIVWGIPVVRTLRNVELRQKTLSHSQIMPIVTFMKLAGERGWQVTGEHDLEAIDLMNGLTQAGVTGIIRFYGRRQAAPRLGPSPLVPIDPLHWHEFEFDWHSVIAAVENMDSLTRKFCPRQNRFITGYVDIHLDSSAAADWLNSQEALVFKGQTAHGERERNGQSRVT